MDNNFEQLLATLNGAVDESAVLAKALPTDKPADDKTIAAAAKEGDQVEGDQEGAEGDEEGEGEAMGKSFEFTDAAGNKQKLLDATDLFKSLTSRLETTDGVLAQALTGMGAALTAQNVMIKSLQATVQDLSLQGRGRKTLLAVLDKPGVGDLMAKSAEAQAAEGRITPQQLMTKSHAAFEAKKITGLELSTIDVCLRNGQTIDGALLSKVATA